MNDLVNALCCTVFLSAGFFNHLAAESPNIPNATDAQVWQSKDSLRIVPDVSHDANVCLQGLSWEPKEFSVSVQQFEDERGDRTVQFPSPIPSGNEVNDVVCMEWYFARKDGKVLSKAPGIVVVHESGSQMEVGRVFASSLAHLGFHTFMIQLPYYGMRRENRKAYEQANQVQIMQQAIADVRRAKDAVAVLPEVEHQTIGLQGTSLGGFVASTAASLDSQYSGVFLMLSGGDLFDIIQNGQKDAAKAKVRLAKQGFSGEKLKEIALMVEPTRLTHRLDPQRVWLYSGLYDTVVPFKNAKILANSIQLEESHHIKMPANHYSGVVFLPMVLTHIQQQMNLLHGNVQPE